MQQQNLAGFISEKIPTSTLNAVRVLCRLRPNKTRQGYARERTLKPAGYFFLGDVE